MTKYDPKQAAANFDNLGEDGEGVVDSQPSWEKQDSEIFGKKPDKPRFPSKAPANAIVPNGDGTMRFLNFRMTGTQLIVPEDISDEEFDALGYMLKGMDNAVQFWIGDWANIYVRPEMNQFESSAIYEDIAEKFGLNKKTLQNYASVCRNLDASLRREALNFSIHREVAELPELLKGQETHFLDWAIQEDASVVKLKMYIAKTLADMQEKKQHIADESFLFSKDRMPKIGNVFQNRWTKARNGDKNAKSLVLDELTQIRKWADEIEESLED
jgi:hypothetical protein